MLRENKKTAFTLIEMSIVLIIVSLMAAAVVGSGNLRKLARIASAKAITESSPVNYIDDVVLWLETVSKTSLLDSEEIDGNTVSSWKNIHIGQTSTDVTQSTVGFRPLYVEDGINDLPAIEFDGDDSFLQSTNNEYLSAKSNFSSFVVFQPDLTNSPVNARIWHWGEHNASVQITLRLGTSLDELGANITDSGSNRYIGTASVFQTNKPYIISNIFNGSGASDNDKFKLYVNGNEISASVTNGPLPSVTGSINFPFTIGSDPTGVLTFAGRIGEIIVINNAVSALQRQAIEEYLSKKWKIN